VGVTSRTASWALLSEYDFHSEEVALFFKAKSKDANREVAVAKEAVIVLSDVAILQVSGGEPSLQATNAQSVNVNMVGHKSAASIDAFTRG
jgi:hypothetical protein